MMKVEISKHDTQAALVKTIGQRMIQAREMCGLSQQAAAELLGYKNSSKLAKIELASDGLSVPLWLIPKASEIYGVSVDWLFGLSDSHERDPVVAGESQIEKWLMDQWQVVKEAGQDSIRDLHARQTAIVNAIGRILRRAKENLQYVEHVQAINPEFDDLRGGSKLMRLLIETAEDAMGISHELRTFRASIGGELAEAERLIGDILNDPRHPANNARHPEHQQAKRALERLESKVNQTRAQTRARLGFEQVIAFEKVSINIK